jgi:hypothetical protein
MSLIKRADVKGHLSTASNFAYPFGLKRPEAKKAVESKDPGAEAEVADISISPNHPISSGAAQSAQVGGSVGVPVSADKSGKGSW